MDSKRHILHSKLRFSGSTDTMVRQRLTSICKDMVRKRLTTVIAGAGYGKSTLVDQILKGTGSPVSWYRLDRYDADIDTFVFYLISGLRRSLSMNGEKMADILTGYNGDVPDYNHVVTVLLNELEAYERDIFIVLDDFHTVRDTEKIRLFIDFMVEYLPHNVHMIIISRSEPGIKLSLYRVRRELLEINERDLAFTSNEIRQLYSDIFHMDMAAHTIEAVRRKTQGWAASLILLFHVLKNKKKGDAEVYLNELEGSSRVISSYIEENVFNDLTDEMKRFLITTSILSRVQVNIVNRLMNIESSGDILKTLEENHLFTFQIDEHGQIYTYHQLFVDFLQARLHQAYNREDIAALHGYAARLLESANCDEDALRHYLSAGMIEEACVLLSKLSTILWSKGIQIIYSFISDIPDGVRNDSPWMTYLKALCAEYAGNHRKALDLFELSYKSFLKDRYETGIDLCMGALGYIYQHTDELIKAEAILKSVVKRVRDNPELKAISLAHLMEAAMMMGKTSEADEYFHDALSCSVEITDQRRHASIRAFIYFIRGLQRVFSGDFHQAETIAHKVRDGVTGFDLDAQTAQYHFLSAVVCYFTARFQEGLDHAGKGIELLREIRIDSFLDNSCLDYAWLLWAYGVNSLNLGNTGDAIRYCEESLSYFKRTGSCSAQAINYFSLAMIYKLTGDKDRQNRNIELGRRSVEDRVLPIQQGMIAGFVAAELLENGKPDEALPLIEKAGEHLKHSTFEAARICFLRARYCWTVGRNDQALSHAVRGLGAFEANQFDFWLLLEFSWCVPLFTEVHARGEMRSYIEKMFVLMGLSGLLESRQQESGRGPAKRIELNEKKNPLHVFCLGPFKVQCGDEDVPLIRWKTRSKARTLFKYLFTTMSKGYQARDVLMELLWPEEDPDKAINKFHVTLSALRKILEPDLGKGEKSAYILNDEGAYRLFLGNGGGSDLYDFLHETERGETFGNEPEKAVRHFMNAEALYKGDLFGEDMYVDWCVNERNRYRDKYLKVLTWLMAYYEKRKDFEKSILHANKYLETDPYDEHVYRQMMSYYSNMGSTAMAVLTYERCRDHIEKNLQCPLSKDIKQYFVDLVAT